MIKACRGAQLLALIVPIATVVFSCNLKTSTQSDADCIVPVTTPSRVPNTQVDYVSLLQEMKVGAVIPNQRPDLSSVISPSLVATCESPLLASDPLLSLHQVFVLGNIAASNLLSCQGSTNLASLVPAYVWIVGGLRKEADLSSRRCAIILEKRLYDESCLRLEKGNAPSNLVHFIEQTYLSETIDFAMYYIGCLKKVRLYGEFDDVATKAVPAICQVLSQMNSHAHNYSLLKNDILGLREMIKAIHSSVKKDAIVAYVDLLFADIELHEAKMRWLENNQAPFGAKTQSAE